MVIILMGVSGAGKTTVGQILATQLGWQFADADDYHSATNLANMRTGIPLTDADRVSWLAILRSLIAGWLADGKSTVLACSALKQSYREILQLSPEVKYVYLKGGPQLLHQRLHTRLGHFMTEQMPNSQLESLEEPENAVVVDVDSSPPEIVAKIRASIDSLRSS